MTFHRANNPAPTWVHGLAILTVLAAVPLFFLGADVTTKGAGMADERAIVNPLQAIQELRQDRPHDFRIEHLHRLAGWFIGMCGIVLAARLWLKEPRRWVCWLGTAALGLIMAQGLLGIFRIHLHAWLGPNLAWIHGAFAPVVLAVLMAVAVVTSPAWVEDRDGTRDRGRGIAVIVCGLVYAQLVIGGMVRHHDFFLGLRLHVAMAFVAGAGVLWLAKVIVEGAGPRWPSWVLLGLLGVQVILGVEAWINRFHHPGLAWNQLQPWSPQTTVPRTLHFVVGAFLFAVCAAWTVNAHRPGRKTNEAASSAREREEVLV